MRDKVSTYVETLSAFGPIRNFSNSAYSANLEITLVTPAFSVAYYAAFSASSECSLKF